MQFTTQNLPMKNSNMQWGTIILAVVIIGGVGLITYNAIKKPVIKEEDS